MQLKQPILFLIVAATFLATVNCNRPPIVKSSENVTIHGIVHQPDLLYQPVHAYMGIPYAERPLRFSSPVAKNWANLTSFNASRPGFQCWQGTGSNNDEDCLNLNVMVPSTAPQVELRPVIVWIHGGNFRAGSGALYDGSSLAATANVVFVSINYRLGAFGFLHTGSSSGNLGIEDQLLALDWVQKEISNFGGDPEKVTIAGHSYGALSVLIHLTSPLSAGKYRAAIMMSLGLGVQPALWTEERQLDRLNLVLASTNCSGAQDTLACLRALPASALAYLPISSWNPRVDGSIISRQPIQALQLGEFNRVPVLVSVTKHEYSYFVCSAPDSTITFDEYRSTLKATLVNEVASYDIDRVVEAILKRFPPSNYNGDSLQAFIDLSTIKVFTCTARLVVEAVAKYRPAYLSSFELPLSYTTPCLGNSHLSELSLIFPNFLGPNQYLSLEEQNLAMFLKSSWGRFVYCGSPNDKEFDWANTAKEPLAYTIISSPLGIGCNLRGDDCKFFEKLIPFPWQNESQNQQSNKNNNLVDDDDDSL